MGLCHDFINEEGILWHIAKGLSIEVLLTPKCHAELAGESVEYIHHKVEYGDFYIEKLNSKYIAGKRGLSTI